MDLLNSIAALASGTLFGQVQNFGHPPPDPEEKRRGEKMIAQAETMIAQNNEAISQSRKAIKQGWIAIVIALLALAVAIVSIFHHP